MYNILVVNRLTIPWNAIFFCFRTLLLKMNTWNSLFLKEVSDWSVIFGRQNFWEISTFLARTWLQSLLKTFNHLRKLCSWCQGFVDSWTESSFNFLLFVILVLFGVYDVPILLVMNIPSDQFCFMFFRCIFYENRFKKLMHLVLRGNPQIKSCVTNSKLLCCIVFGSCYLAQVNQNHCDPVDFWGSRATRTFGY